MGECPALFSRSLLTFRLYKAIVPSPLANASVLLSFEKARAKIYCEFSFIVAKSLRVAKSHNLSVLSELPVASILPSAVKPSAHTSYYPVSFYIIFFSSGSQTIIYASLLPETSLLPFGENTTDIIP
jgi:hypothetical protein